MKRGQENITDEELLKRYCESGDLVYFVEAYKRYMPLVYGVALKYLKRPEDAQDAVMQLFEELIVKVKETEIQSFKAWLYTCIRNNCLMEIRKRSKNLSVSLDDSFMEFCFLNELSYKEVEERTGFSSKMVKSFIQNGKRNLKLCLERKGITSNETD